MYMVGFIPNLLGPLSILIMQKTDFNIGWNIFFLSFWNCLHQNKYVTLTGLASLFFASLTENHFILKLLFLCFAFKSVSLAFIYWNNVFKSIMISHIFHEFISNVIAICFTRTLLEFEIHLISMFPYPRFIIIFFFFINLSRN